MSKVCLFNSNFFYSALEIRFSNILLDQFVVLKVIVAGPKNSLDLGKIPFKQFSLLSSSTEKKRM